VRRAEEPVCASVVLRFDERTPLLLGFDGQLTAEWFGAEDLLGGHTSAFIDALSTFLDQRGIIAEVKR
jgi:hypothetical protein